jgi:thiamine-monophosphate kinase
VGEFELIEKFFAQESGRDDVLLGIGDDAALIDAGTSRSVACALASVNGGGAGAPQSDAGVLAHELVCTAFNHLASRGVSPAWFTLALCLPDPREDWLETFSRALFAAAAPCGAALIGGDTARGPLAATLVAHGTLPVSTAAKPPAAGDAVYMTGKIGCRRPLQGAAAAADERISRLVPPRVDAGVAAAAHVSAAADIRRSLAATLSDLLEPFGLGARVDASALPVAEASAELARRPGGAKLLAETAADPELCFIVTPEREPGFCRAMDVLSTPCTRIGVVSRDAGVRIQDARVSGT